MWFTKRSSGVLHIRGKLEENSYIGLDYEPKCSTSKWAKRSLTLYIVKENLLRNDLDGNNDSVYRFLQSSALFSVEIEIPPSSHATHLKFATHNFRPSFVSKFDVCAFVHQPVVTCRLVNHDFPSRKFQLM